jgi:hypothetical protein
MGDIKSVMHGDVEIISPRALGKLIQTNNLINQQETTRQSQEAERESYYNKYKVYVPYNNGSTYYLSNKVTYNGSSFQCKVEETTGNAPTSDGTDNTQWLCISKKGDKGDAGGSITNATQLPITDTGNYYTTDDTNSALQEIASRVGDLTELETESNADLVNSINEILTRIILSGAEYPISAHSNQIFYKII